jgi:cell division protein FtsI (penicillin-binding protein 3)
MRKRRKNPNWKLAAAALALVAVVALLLALPAWMPRPETKSRSELVPVGVFAGRKNIYDRRLRELAVSLRLTSVYARPLELRDPEMTASELAPILKRDEKELLSALKSERSFVWLARRLDSAQAERVAALKAKGLYFFDEEQRYYPQHETAAHVLGFLSNDQGLAGIEFYYDQILQGWEQGRKLPRDLQSIPDLAGEKEGASLVLTLDLDSQARLERDLDKTRQKTKAAGAMALVMEPESGEIHALVSLPTFDPNRFWEYNSAARRNRVLVDAVYPGGLWNLFRVATATADGVPESAASPKGGGTPFLSPRRNKTGKGAAEHLNRDWAKFGDGIFVSPILADIPLLPLEEGELDRLLHDLEMGKQTGIDLPIEAENSPSPASAAGLDHKGNTAAISALQLLTGFNRLLSAEGTAPPHLLKALWPSKKKQMTVDYQKQPSTVGTAADLAVRSILQGNDTRAGGMAESLVDKSLLASATDAGETEQPCRQQDVLFGISRGEKPFTFLLVLDGACIDPSKPSLLRKTGRRLLQWLASPPPKASRSPKASASPSSVDNPPDELYRQWQLMHHPAVHGGGGVALRITDRMPNVEGLALRAALQELQPYGVPIEISGSGRVIGQAPKAGSPLTDIDRIKLELKTK